MATQDTSAEYCRKEHGINEDIKKKKRILVTVNRVVSCCTEPPQASSRLPRYTMHNAKFNPYDGVSYRITAVCTGCKYITTFIQNNTILELPLDVLAGSTLIMFVAVLLEMQFFYTYTGIRYNCRYSICTVLKVNNFHVTGNNFFFYICYEQFM
jgi:hypothetical protein